MRARPCASIVRSRSCSGRDRRTAAGSSLWADAALAAALLAVDPVAMGGVALRARAGPVRDPWLALLRGLLPPAAPVRRLPLHVTDGRLLGGLDLAATLRAGRPVADRGLLAEAEGGVLLVAMAERLTPGTAARLTGTLDAGEVLLERDGLALRTPARIRPGGARRRLGRGRASAGGPARPAGVPDRSGQRQRPRCHRPSARRGGRGCGTAVAARGPGRHGDPGSAVRGRHDARHQLGQGTVAGDAGRPRGGRPCRAARVCEADAAVAGGWCWRRVPAPCRLPSRRRSRAGRCLDAGSGSGPVRRFP